MSTPERNIADIRAEKVLDTPQRFGRFGIMTRREFVEDRVAEGWRVIHVNGSREPRRFAENGDKWGGFFTPSAMTETAFRYAETIAKATGDED